MAGLSLVPGAYDALSARIVEHVGFPAVTAGGYAAVGALPGKRAMEALLRDRSFAAVEDEIIPLEGYYDVVRLKRHNDLDQGYVEKAEAQVAKKKPAAE